jgi:hypothetical protein
LESNEFGRRKALRLFFFFFSQSISYFFWKPTYLLVGLQNTFKWFIGIGKAQIGKTFGNVEEGSKF